MKPHPASYLHMICPKEFLRLKLAYQIIVLCVGISIHKVPRELLFFVIIWNVWIYGHLKG